MRRTAARWLVGVVGATAAAVLAACTSQPGGLLERSAFPAESTWDEEGFGLVGFARCEGLEAVAADTTSGWAASVTVVELPVSHEELVERLDEGLRACAAAAGESVANVADVPADATGWVRSGERELAVGLTRLGDGRLLLVGLAGSGSDVAPVSLEQLIELGIEGAERDGSGRRATSTEGQTLVVRTTLLLHAIGLVELPADSLWFDDDGKVRSLQWIVETGAVQDFAGYAAEHLNVAGLTTGDLTSGYGGTVLVQQGE